MRKTMVIAVREYQAAVKTKMFVVSLVAMPVMMGGSIYLQMALDDRVDVSDKRVAILDPTGLIFDAISQAAAKRNTSDIFDEDDPSRQVKPRFLVERITVESQAPDEIKLELSTRVRDKDFLAFVLIGPDVINPSDDVARSSIGYYSNSPTYEDFQDWVSGPINEQLRSLRFQQANLDTDIVDKATKRVRVDNLGLVSMDETGTITQAEKTNRLANLFLPMGIMMLMFMVIMVGAQPLTQTVIEEKTLRIAEVLLGSVTPFELMMGKLLGVVGVSMTLLTVYLVGGYIALDRAGYGAMFPTHLVWWFVVFQFLAVLFFGSMFIAVGAAVTDLKEAQSALMPLMIIVMAPMFVWLNVVKEPNSTFAVAASLFPPATPILMCLRMAVPPGIPVWQPLLGVLLVIISTIICVLIAGRIFRVGLLGQGKAPKLREVLRWVISG